MRLRPPPPALDLVLVGVHPAQAQVHMKKYEKES